jgi:hypothetical protein
METGGAMLDDGGQPRDLEAGMKSRLKAVAELKKGLMGFAWCFCCFDRLLQISKRVSFFHLTVVPCQNTMLIKSPLIHLGAYFIQRLVVMHDKRRIVGGSKLSPPQKAVAGLLLATFLLVSAGAFAEPQDKATPAKMQVSPSEIKKLIADLAHKDFREREKATKRLGEIGLPALKALQEAADNGDAETRQRATNLAKGIRAANCLPTRVSQMEFRLIVEKEWAIPKPGQIKKIGLSLEFKNTASEAVRLYLYKSVRVIIKELKGNDLLKGGFQTSDSAHSTTSPLLAKNQIFLLPFAGKLSALTEGTVSVWFQDVFACTWSTRNGIPKGTYKFSLGCENAKAATDAGEKCWVGNAETLTETVVIK